MSAHKHAAYLNLDQFHYNAKSRTLTAEASEVDMGFCLYDTLNIKSDKTGRLVTFDLAETKRNTDFEKISWTYTSKQSQVTVIIFND